MSKLRDAAQQALEALIAATPVKAKDPQMQADAIVALRAALAEQAEQEPVAAQHRFRHPEKGTPDWSVWQPCKINNKRPAHEIDSQGYQVEYRALYTAAQPQPKQEPREHITDGSPCWCNPEVDYIDPETGAAVIVHRRPQ